MQHTVLGDFLDLKFIDYFCNELYRERNEILHGNADDFATELNAAKKLATIEYLLITINNHLAKDLSEYLEKEVPSEILEGTFDALNQLLSV